MREDNSESTKESEDLSPEEVAAGKRRSRINAATLFLIFLLTAFAPYPWKALAPLLFLLPIVYSLYNRLRGAPGVSDRTRIPEIRTPVVGAPTEEPFSYRPQDPKDPRRYKPIG